MSATSVASAPGRLPQASPGCFLRLKSCDLDGLVRQFQNIKLRFIVTVYNRGHGSIHGIFGIHGITAVLCCHGGVPLSARRKQNEQIFVGKREPVGKGRLLPIPPSGAPSACPPRLLRRWPSSRTARPTSADSTALAGAPEARPHW